MLLNTPVEVYPILWRSEKQDMSSLRSVLTAYMKWILILFSVKETKYFRKREKNIISSHLSMCAMQAFNNSPGNSHAEADDLQSK